MLYMYNPLCNDKRQSFFVVMPKPIFKFQVLECHLKSIKFKPIYSHYQAKIHVYYENLSLKITLKNHNYSENQDCKRKCYTDIFSVLCQCNFQRCFCLT